VGFESYQFLSTFQPLSAGFLKTPLGQIRRQLSRLLVMDRLLATFRAVW
jgi:hypothetical protein